MSRKRFESRDFRRSGRGAGFSASVCESIQTVYGRTYNARMKQRIWRRLDEPGFEWCRLASRGADWQLAGTAVVAFDGLAWRIAYEVGLDSTFATSSCVVRADGGSTHLDLIIARDGNGRWFMNGHEQPQVAGCIDVDLAFSPATNTLPIRRLRPQPGESVDVRAAWLRFPDFSLDVLPQTYRRVDGRRYHYESNGGSFMADLTVDESGLVLEYENLWRAESAE